MEVWRRIPESVTEIAVVARPWALWRFGIPSLEFDDVTGAVSEDASEKPPALFESDLSHFTLWLGVGGLLVATITSAMLGRRSCNFQRDAAMTELSGFAQQGLASAAFVGDVVDEAGVRTHVAEAAGSSWPKLSSAVSVCAALIMGMFSATPAEAIKSDGVDAFSMSPSSVLAIAKRHGVEIDPGPMTDAGRVPGMVNNGSPNSTILVNIGGREVKVGLADNASLVSEDTIKRQKARIESLEQEVQLLKSRLEGKTEDPKQATDTSMIGNRHLNPYLV
jgi:hypothetical protein